MLSDFYEIGKATIEIAPFILRFKKNGIFWRYSQ